MSDLISRQAAIDAFGLSEKTRKYGGDHSGYDTMMLYEIQGVLVDLPSVQPERIRGRWEIYVISMLDGEGCRCSECGFEGVPYWDFCPNCGADMREQEGKA